MLANKFTLWLPSPPPHYSQDLQDCGVHTRRIWLGNVDAQPYIIRGGGGKVKHEKWATHQPPSTSEGVVDTEQLRDDDMMIL